MGYWVFRVVLFVVRLLGWGWYPPAFGFCSVGAFEFDSVGVVSGYCPFRYGRVDWPVAGDSVLAQDYVVVDCPVVCDFVVLQVGLRVGWCVGSRSLCGVFHE